MAQAARKILFITDTTVKPKALYIDQVPKLAKGFIRQGHDVRCLNYVGLLAASSPFKSRSLSRLLYKTKTDKSVCRYVSHYRPDIIFLTFPRFVDVLSIQRIKNASGLAQWVGIDGDPWPGENPGRLDVGAQMDIMLATNNGVFLDAYRNAGVRKCVFMPNVCDPDLDRRYDVDAKWHRDILWTGKVQHKAGLNTGDTSRQDVIQLLANDPRVTLYGCFDRPQVAGLDYLHAISGARIGLSINAINTVPMYHSDRFTFYTACGTMVLAKRVPDTERLMEDRKHVVYFDSEEECLELAEWYLSHEEERKKIADAGMQRCHELFNPVKITGSMLDVIDTGRYSAPWGDFS